MSRTGENIYKRKDGRWEGRYIKAYSVDNKAQYGYLYAKTYAEIKVKLGYAISNTHLEDPFPSYYFEEVAGQWLQNVKMNCKQSTYNKYRNTCEKILVPYFGKSAFLKIRSENVDAFMEGLLTNGRKNNQPYSRKTAQEICMTMKQVVQYAEFNYNIKPNFNVKKLHVKYSQPDIEPLNAAEMEKLTHYLLTEPDERKIGILIALYTGLRLGELCALQWKDISFQEGTIHIGKTIQRIQELDSPGKKTKLVITSPKTESSCRIIPLPPVLLHLLSKWKCEKEVFILSGTTECYEPRNMQNALKRYLTACHVRTITFHTLRHTFATQCVERGVDIKTLSEILGHASVNITLNRYIHSSMEQKRKAMNLLTFS